MASGEKMALLDATRNGNFIDDEGLMQFFNFVQLRLEVTASVQKYRPSDADPTTTSLF
jgi:hypothetical protein